jgi:DNA-binding winged helix-turn-helix (wHTH) protein
MPALMPSPAEPIALGPFRVDMDGNRLLRDGVEVTLRPRAFRALKVLIQNSGRLVDYGQMIREGWDGIQVSNHTVVVTIGEVKDVLNECGSWITSRPKFGYCLVVPASEELIRRGRHFWDQYTRTGFESALKCFERAAENDGGDFRAFEGIAGTCLMLAGFEMRAPSELHTQFQMAHARAVALCGLTPELRLDRAFALLVFEQKLEEAEAELLDLRRQLPRSTLLAIRLAVLFMAFGRLTEAREMMLQASEGSDLFQQFAFLEIVLALFCRDFQTAVELGKKTVDLHPGSQIGRAFYAQALEYAGFSDEALIQYRLAAAMTPGSTWIRAHEAMCLAKCGRKAEAMEILRSLQRRRTAEYVDAYLIALLLAALGKRDRAFVELERAYREKSYTLLFADVDAKADSLRSDPRFMALRAKVFGRKQGASAA